jgi:hypothetical protein
MIKDAIILGLVTLVAWLAFGQRQEPQALVEDVTVAATHAQAVTNPRGQARVTLRVAPCVTIDPAPVQVEDHA